MTRNRCKNDRMRPNRLVVFPFVLLAALSVAPVAPAGAQTKRPITIDDLLKLQRVGDPQISPDGATVVYAVTVPDKAANKSTHNLWIVPTRGGAPRQLTTSGSDTDPRWSPDGKQLAFLSSRGGEAQIYVLALAGGEANKVTTVSGGVDMFVWSPDGASFAFTSKVFPDCQDDACNAKRAKDDAAGKVKIRVYDDLLYRHWTEWRTGTRGHLFVTPVAGGAAKDLTQGAKYDVPPGQREGPHPIAFSPDSKQIAFTAIDDPMEAASTNGDIFTVPADGSSAAVRLTKSAGFDGAPAYSPDGKYLAFHSQARPGVESDRWRLMRLDRQSGETIELTPSFDRSVDALAWSPDSKTIYFGAEDSTYEPVFSVAASGGMPKAINPKTMNTAWALSANGTTFVMLRASQNQPGDLVASAADGSDSRELTHQNAELLAALDLPAAEHFTFAGAGGTEVSAMLLRPPAFDASKKYPVVMILHGGPETMFGDAWSYRWNSQMFAAPGYAVLQINRRGSTGFGQAFTDGIVDDWGGKPYQDLMKGLDAALAKYPFLDGTRVAAAGASYGGYMIDWMESQSKGRFKALVSHAGVYNLASMYGATEELWFPEAEFKGTPWTNKAAYERSSASTYAAEFGKYKTPTLVSCGELDFRVPYTQSLEFYTALQRQGVPSRLVVVPDEGHWILKPANSAFWYGQVMEWLKKYL